MNKVQTLSWLQGPSISCLLPCCRSDSTIKLIPRHLNLCFQQFYTRTSVADKRQNSLTMQKEIRALYRVTEIDHISRRQDRVISLSHFQERVDTDMGTPTRMQTGRTHFPIVQ